MIYSNIIEKKTVREVQLKTLEIIKNALVCSFGPMGSNTAIRKEKALTKYSKDGHTILQSIIFNRPIEYTVKDDLEDLTRYIVKTVGDGTTSAIILASFIFNEMTKMEEEDKIPPFTLIEKFKAEVARVCDAIRERKQIATVQDMYNIALIATNGNKEVASNIANIYNQYGMQVFIDVNISNTTEDMLKSYDGMTLEAGYADSCFINDTVKGTASIHNAKVYVFEDPVDTPEMVSLFDTIIGSNIMRPFSEQRLEDVVPTVILAPKLSKDMSSYMDLVTKFMAQADASVKPPLLIVTNIYNQDMFMDIAGLCGSNVIKKYRDPKVQELDITRGLAATQENVLDFGGTCDLVESDINKTKFVRPGLMLNENGEKSELFKGMLTYLEAELKNAQDNNEDSTVIGRLKRRINSLKANMVEYLVGGVSMSDRDSLRDLVEDAVLNCRSAAKDGYGYGANFEGLRAANALSSNEPDNKIMAIIAKAYGELTVTLYNTYTMDEVESAKLMQQSLTENDAPFNIRTEFFDGLVLSSINSDIVILDTIAKIVTLMFTCNQYICQSPAHNVYGAPGEE